MTLIKVCGITNKVDAMNASRLGVDMLGFVFYEKSKRYITQNAARQIVDQLPDTISKVGVFVDEGIDKVRAIAEEALLDTVQLHGNETPEYCRALKKEFRVIKAFRIKHGVDLQSVNSYDVDYYLVDAHSFDLAGGTGKTFDWNILKDFEFLKPVILSGGLNPDNVGRAIAEVVPYGVDVSTGVEESPGKKSPRLLNRFVEEVRKV